MQSWTLTINGYNFIITDLLSGRVGIAYDSSQIDSKAWDYRNPDFINAWNKITADWEEIKSIHILESSVSMWTQIYEDDDDPVGRVFQIMNSEYASERTKALARSVLTVEDGGTYKRKRSKRNQN